MRRAELRELLRPRRLLRVRTSTWVLLVIFLAALTAYAYFKPPAPTQSGGTQNTTVQPSNTPEPGRTSSPTATPTSTQTATPSSTAPKAATPGADNSPTVTPAASADPSPLGSPP